MKIRHLSFLVATAWLAASPAIAGTTEFTIQTSNVGAMSLMIDPSSKDNAKLQTLDAKGKPEKEEIYGPGKECSLSSTGTQGFQVNGYTTSFNLYLRCFNGKKISGNITLSASVTSGFKVAFANWNGATATYDPKHRTIKIVAPK
ncbi:MAG TPA: hypothetical protein VK188_18345 [Holophaga sp.]|nr:hypothetical protein [Holophaga sp.]